MDSITQITLGAAVGEVVLGKKAGNRAMLWGAVAGTIPDLDIVTNLFMEPVDALAAHRGISHSIFFAIVTAPVFGYLVYQFYQKGIDRSTWVKRFSALLVGLLCLFVAVLPFRSVFSGGTFPGLPWAIFSSLLLIFAGSRLYRYLTTQYSDLGARASLKDWSWLFFWGVFTHPLLDCFTSYGTQLFLPFTDYRVAFSTISVADPLYTVPFILCLIGASYFSRNSSKRKWVNWAGILISSLYLTFTVRNKYLNHSIFENALTKHGIQAERLFVSPTIFNNYLWQGIAESSDKFYYGLYSLNDTQPTVKIDSLYKKPENTKAIEAYRETKILQWFTNGYYIIDKIGEDQYQMNDLRFGIIGNLEEPRDTTKYVFKFILTENDKGLDVQSKRSTDRDVGKDVKKLWTRIKGI